MKKTYFGIVVLALLLSVGLLSVALGAPQEDAESSSALWRDVSETTLREGERQIVPARYRTLAVELDMLEALLLRAPQERTIEAQQQEVLLPLPLPDGTTEHFRIESYAMMEAELAAKYPNIRTYLGQGLEDPTASVRLDLTPDGFHAMIISSGGTVYIDPYRRDDRSHYISYYKQDAQRDASDPDEKHEEVVLTDEVYESFREMVEGLEIRSSGDELRSYRLAMAATGEYTQFHGGTVASALAAIVTTMNRVNGIYERDVAVRMLLIANNDQIIYTNGATDPYSNNDGFLMLFENQTNIDAVIGNGNYDVGHVFSTGGGGIAGLGVPCRAGLKARGVTGSSNPIGDPFDVDYVAHEIGHQYGANHTFNGTTFACGGGNRNGSTAYEPGSGSTIMAYAGICGAENLQLNSDDYFHSVSFDEIVAYTTVGMGNSCANITATGNSAPTANAGANYTIPAQTPFELTGSGSDPNGDTLTYNWEQFDLGDASPPNTDNGNRPIFRSFDSVSGSGRTFPQLTDILNNTSTFGESLPTTNRTLNFRLTVRDNRANGGGVAYDSTQLTVSNSAGPFEVTAPNTSVTWTGGTMENVAWDVANSNVAPVSCANVDILLSTDGGFTFPHTLAASTPNDGNAAITVPNAPTSSARVKVVCSNNIFFDISNVNFTVMAGGPTVTPTISTPTATVATGTATATVVTGTATATVTGTVPTSTATATATMPSATATATPTATATTVPSTYSLYLPVVMK